MVDPDHHSHISSCVAKFSRAHNALLEAITELEGGHSVQEQMMARAARNSITMILQGEQDMQSDTDFTPTPPSTPTGILSHQTRKRAREDDETTQESGVIPHLDNAESEGRPKKKKLRKTSFADLPASVGLSECTCARIRERAATPIPREDMDREQKTVASRRSTRICSKHIQMEDLPVSSTSSILAPKARGKSKPRRRRPKPSGSKKPVRRIRSTPDEDRQSQVQDNSPPQTDQSQTNQPPLAIQMDAAQTQIIPPSYSQLLVHANFTNLPSDQVTAITRRVDRGKMPGVEQDPQIRRADRLAIKKIMRS